MRIGRLFLDSADLKLVAAASAWKLSAAVSASGVVSGITTNPAIMNQHTTNGPAHLRSRLDAFEDGPVFYQLTSDTSSGAWAEIGELDDAAGQGRDRVVLKLPTEPWLYSIAARLTAADRQVAFTAISRPRSRLLRRRSWRPLGHPVCRPRIAAGR